MSPQMEVLQYGHTNGSTYIRMKVQMSGINKFRKFWGPISKKMNNRVGGGGGDYSGLKNTHGWNGTGERASKRTPVQSGQVFLSCMNKTCLKQTLFSVP